MLGQNINNGKSNNKFKYKKLLSHYTKDVNQILSITFNKNSTVLFIGGPKIQIKIFGFNDKQKQIQTLIGGTVFQLFFIKKFNQLVSQTHNAIIIWNQDKDNLWKPNQILQEQIWISYCIINKMENLLIYGSNDGKIKFWNQVNSIWNCYQTIDAQCKVTCISLNYLNTKLILCFENRIEMMESQQNQKWTLIQTIKVNNLGYNLIFINNDQFIFQPSKQSCLEIYHYEQENKQFIKNKEISVETCMACKLGFDSQFIEQQNILMVRNKCQYDLFQIDDIGEIIFQQKIQCDHSYMTRGKLTDKAKYLVIWGMMNQSVIQVRGLQYLE